MDIFKKIASEIEEVIDGPLTGAQEDNLKLHNGNKLAAAADEILEIEAKMSMSFSRGDKWNEVLRTLLHNTNGIDHDRALFLKEKLLSKIKGIAKNAVAAERFLNSIE